MLLSRKIRTNPDCARYVAGKDLTFDIRTESGSGRQFFIQNGRLKSSAKIKHSSAFSLVFKDGQKGFAVLSAKDGQPAFLRGIGSGDLKIAGNAMEVFWFQGLTAFLQHPNEVSPMDRSVY
jgi:hypothetical protein